MSANPVRVPSRSLILTARRSHRKTGRSERPFVLALLWLWRSSMTLWGGMKTLSTDAQGCGEGDIAYHREVVVDVEGRKEE